MIQLDVDRDTPEYRAYLDTLDYLERLKRSGAPAAEESGELATPSEYWQEELAGFDYMLDASPLIIRKLRHHCYHITGLRVYEYRTGKSSAAVEARLDELRRAGDPSLVIPEARELGGFGFEVDGELYNVDTLKYTEVLMGLDRSGALAPFRHGGARRVVWEIGAGWGGFAYQFKKSFSDTTYLISDLPELFLFSVVYLRALFPEARVGLCTGPDHAAELLANWRDHDFIFIPNSMTDAVRGVCPDLTINMVSFQEMTSEQVTAYVDRAAELGCPHLYSLNRDRSVYNEEISDVRKLIRRRYVLRDCPVLETDYAAGAKGKRARGRAGGYQHTLGILRERRVGVASRTPV